MTSSGFASVVAAIVYVVVILFVSLRVAITARRMFGIPAEETRKLVHLQMGCASAMLPLFALSLGEIVLLTITACCAVVLVRFSSADENGLGSVFTCTRGTSSSECFFALGVGASLCAATTNLAGYFVALFILTFADAAAGLIGRRFGRTLWHGSVKTLEGSLAFLAVSAIICGVSVQALALPPFVLLLCLCIMVTLVEAYSPSGSDNLTIPAAVTIMMTPTPAAVIPAALLVTGFMVRTLQQASNRTPTHEGSRDQVTSVSTSFASSWVDYPRGEA